MQILGPIVRGIKHNLRAFCKRNSFADNPVSVGRHFFALQVEGGQAVEVANAGLPVECGGDFGYLVDGFGLKTDNETTQNPVMVTVLSEMQKPLPFHVFGRGLRVTDGENTTP